MRFMGVAAYHPKLLNQFVELTVKRAFCVGNGSNLDWLGIANCKFWGATL